ncbi:MAG: DUF2961 domain-containing protein [Rikenellaceae bacterium]|nr:DUF2961 domain-containing protein [Rikenellaceae bacterium]
MKRFIITLLLCPAILGACRGDKYEVTLETLLDEMVSCEAMTRFPDYRCLQQSSYDRRSVSPDAKGWFANNDGFGFIRTDTIDGRVEKVLFEDFGPGAITRIWKTAMNKNGTLRFYFDGSAAPGWTVPCYDLVKFGIPMGEGMILPHTSYTEEGKGGSTFFLPISYASGCRVTLELPAGEKETPKYYQFNYRKYPAGKRVDTFSAKVAARAANKIIETGRLLAHPNDDTSGIKTEMSGTLEAGSAIEMELPRGGNAVSTIYFSIEVDPADYERLMRGLFFRASFDGETTVDLPLGDFSGGGLGARPVASWYLASDGAGNIVSRWRMPYREYGSIALVNHNGEELRASVTAFTSPYRWDENSLYFHSSWKQELSIPLTPDEEKCFDWNFTTLYGRGIYAGDVLSLFNHAPSWYGEGDEKIYVDGEEFPSHFGTGTEDYYNSSWAPVVVFQTPFGGAPRADLESSHGYNTFFRTRNLDAIPFNRSFVFDLEMLSWQEGTADYYTTIYWYGDPPTRPANISSVEEALLPLPEAPVEKERYKVEGATEFENLQPYAKSASISADVQNMVGFSGDNWSNSHQLLCVGGTQGDYISFRFTGFESGQYDAEIYLTRAPDYGKVSSRINDVPTGVEYDGWSDDIANSGAVRLGSFTPVDGAFTLTVDITGTNPSSVGNRYFVGLDCIRFIKK